MVPVAYVWLTALPLTHNGKLDRKALPPPESESARDATTYVAPRNEIEATLAGIWQGRTAAQAGRRDGQFFEIGGDSILSLLVISRANRAGLRITPNQIFQHQTIAALAAAAETIERPTETQEPVHGRFRSRRFRTGSSSKILPTRTTGTRRSRPRLQAGSSQSCLNGRCKRSSTITTHCGCVFIAVTRLACSQSR